MSYKDNKYFKKHCAKHKDINAKLRPLEIFCKNNGITMEVYGSVTRKDYYHGKSDYDIVFVSDDIDDARDRFENFMEIDNKSRIIERYTIHYKDFIHYSVNEDVVQVPGFKYKLSIDNYKNDLIIVNKNDFKIDYNQSLILAKQIGFIPLFILGIIKFIYYQLNLIPSELYIYLKNFILDTLYSRRMHYIKSLPTK
jgi:predicted nucleotidyltransferase